jgi:hypothetical protein
LLTVNKAGANQGRQFYTCARPRDDPAKYVFCAARTEGVQCSIGPLGCAPPRCKYFQWADEEPRARHAPAAGGYAGMWRRSRIWARDGTAFYQWFSCGTEALCRGQCAVVFL